MTIIKYLKKAAPLSLIISCQLVYANTDSPQHIEQPTGMWIDNIPKFIDQTPSFLPQESNHKVTPDKKDTEKNSYIDYKQSKFSNSLQKRAASINNWFGENDPEKPASASLRIMIDTYWNEYDDFEVKPRIRGKIKLPALQDRFSIVFGDDTIDNEIRNNIAITNENPQGNPDKTIDSRQSRDDNASLALRWSEWKNPWGVDSDLDLGVRSGDDIYVRANLEKDWDLENNFTTHVEQIYRYGLKSEHYTRTNFEIRHAKPEQAFLTNQFSLIYTDNDVQEFYWENRLFRQHQFFNENCFNYGVYLGGDIQDSTPELDSYGPFVSWRQPFLRDWFFIQSELTYYNDKNLDRDHHVGAMLRFETHFK